MAKEVIKTQSYSRQRIRNDNFLGNKTLEGCLGAGETAQWVSPPGKPGDLSVSGRKLTPGRRLSLTCTWRACEFLSIQDDAEAVQQP